MKAVDTRNIEDLKQVIKNGENPDYCLFWGGFMSQWARSPFTVDGVEYPTAEHWMMVRKAEMFNDQDALNKILKTSDPKTAKAIGRQVRGFEKDTWEKDCFDLVVEGNVEKFTQNVEFEKQLIGTGDAVLVEASPYDKIWGIGLDSTDYRAQDPFTWKGTNFLGFALMEVRAQIKELH